MAAELNARSLESSESSSDRLELDGLESFFEDDQLELYAKGLSIKQAVFYYGDTRKSLKTKVLGGEVPAIRLPESHGRKWRVFPDGVPAQLQDLIPKKLRDKDNQKNAEVQSSEQVEEARVADEPVHSADSLGLPSAPLSTAETGQAPPVESYPANSSLLFQPAQSEAVELDTNTVDIAPSCLIQAELPILVSETLQDTGEAATALETNAQPEQYARLLERVAYLEKQLAETSYHNSYLETRLTGLEDQVKFLTQEHCQKINFNKILLVIPVLALLAAVLLFRLSAQAQL